MQDDDPSPPAVICNTTHLTSFSLLISIVDEEAEVGSSMKVHIYMLTLKLIHVL